MTHRTSPRGAAARRSGRAFAATCVALLVLVASGGPPSAAAGAPVTPPDLRIFVPTDLISIGVGPGSGDRQLRFTHRTADVGSGPFEIDPTYNPNTGTSTFVQVIYNSPRPGVWNRDHTVPVAATGVWHPPSDYAFPLTRFTLNEINADGSPGRVVATSPKTDYCITGDYQLSGIPNTPDQTSPPQDDCGNPNKPLGWSVGWADQYDQTDAGQPIDLSGVPDGTYILHAAVDPQHVFTESNAANDVTDTRLRIAGDNVTVLSQTTPGQTPPTVSITSPLPRSDVSGTVVIRASAAATAPATISSVQFLVDGQPLGTPDTQPPYAIPWRVANSGGGPHLLSARATDSAGNVATATPVAVRVIAPGGAVGLRVHVLRWRAGTLTLVASGLPRGAVLSVVLRVPRRRSRTVRLRSGHAHIRTPRPRIVVLRVLRSGHRLGQAIVANLDTRPSVRIANPLRGETVSGTIPVVASASDDVAVTSVRFLLDGRPLGRPVTRAPYVIHWRTTRTRRGSHRLTAVATDAAGNTARSDIGVHVQNPAPPMTCFVMQAHLSVHGVGSATTAPFHTAAAGETLLAFVSADGPAGAQQQHATVSGAGLGWRLVRRANGSSGDAEIWSARAPAILHDAEVTATLASPGFNASLTVVAMEGSGGAGSSAAASGSTGAPSAELRTTRPTSLVFAVGNDWDRAARRILPPGWLVLDQWLDTSTGDTFWTQYTNQPAGRAGTVVRARDTAPTGDQWNLAAVELTGEG